MFLCYSLNQSGYPCRRKHSDASCPLRLHGVQKRLGSRLRDAVPLAEVGVEAEGSVLTVNPSTSCLSSVERMVVVCCSARITRE